MSYHGHVCDIAWGICLYVHICVYTHTCACGGQESMVDAFRFCLPPYFLKLALPVWWEWLTTELSGCSCLYFPAMELEVYTVTHDFLHSFWDFKHVFLCLQDKCIMCSIISPTHHWVLLLCLEIRWLKSFREL